MDDLFIAVTAILDAVEITTVFPVETRNDWFKLIAKVFPFITPFVFILVLIQCIHSRHLVVLFVCLIGFFALPGSISGSRISFAPIKSQSDFYYDTFPNVIKQIQLDRFSIFVKRWAPNDDFVRVSYALFIYRVFFDKKLPTAEPFKPYRVNPQSIDGSVICLIGSEKNIASGLCGGTHLLTDDLEAVKKQIKFSLVKTIDYQNERYYLVRQSLF